MTPPDEPELLRAECIFGSQQILPLIDAFCREIGGVREARDSEHIHRMRVASRRLRAALPLFVSCIPEKKYRQWMVEIQRITRALGDARDADVQILFLKKLVKKQAAGTPALSYPLQGAAERVLLRRLEKKRSGLQDTVVTALKKLEDSGIIEDMRVFFLAQKTRAGSTRKNPPPYGIAPVAAARISRRLALFLTHEQWVHNPDAIAEHHALRIAAKKLRYTMEIYAPLYRRGLKKPLTRIKKIQEILGDLHDCDVWIDAMMGLLLKERRTSRESAALKEVQAGNLTSFRQFLLDREKERKILYRRFVRYWNAQRRSLLWEELAGNLNTAPRRRYRFLVTCKEEEVRHAVSRLAACYPAGVEHSQKVAALALQLFDDLEPLHHMGGRERFLLECACLLHDIGWKFGQKGHAGRSAEMILSDAELPLGLIERGITGLVAQAHRGKIRIESEGIFSLIGSEDRTHVLMLSALIRVADGLDYLHLGSIQSVHALPGTDQVFLEITAVRDVSAEKEHALGKSDLFVRVFDRMLVIR